MMHESSKGSSPVRRRCIRLVEVLHQCGYANELPLETAKTIFRLYLGLLDRATLKAYFGTQAHRSIRKLNIRGQYSSGTVSNKTLELTQDIAQTKGYLEILGLATIQRKGNTWFLKLNETSLVAEMSSHTKENSETLPEVSLSSNSGFSRGEGSEGNRFEKVSLDVQTTERQQTHTLQSEREKSEREYTKGD